MLAMLGQTDWHTFAPGTPTHGAAVLAIGLGSLALVGLRRRLDEDGGRRLDAILAAALLAVWLVVVVYYAMPARRSWAQSLPIHVCHVSGLAAPVALLLRTRVARAIVYFWGLGLSSQALLTPMVTVGPAEACFWIFWAFHGGIILTGVYDLAGRGYRPGWGDWGRAAVVGLVYAPVVFAVDWRLWVDYAWLGRGETAGWSLLCLFGRYPGRVPEMVLAGLTAMAGLTLAWPANWPRVRPVEPRPVPSLPQRPTLVLPVVVRPARPLRSAA